ncbi:hypothetical protein CR513_10808, partial [Mucuna pruriens]
MRSLMSTQVGEDDDSHGENIFHSRCHVTGKLCSIIIDGGSYINVASSRLVQKLKLPTLSYPKPYKLQWLNSEGELMITKQVSLAFVLGKYKDEVLCDVLPMEATHIVLGRPWEYDRKVTHNGVTNIFTFFHRGEKVILKPLSLKNMNKDQIKMKMRREKEKGKNEKRRKEKNKEEKRKEDVASKVTMHPKDSKRPKKNIDKKVRREGSEEGVIGSKGTIIFVIN